MKKLLLLICALNQTPLFALETIRANDEIRVIKNCVQWAGDTALATLKEGSIYSVRKIHRYPSGQTWFLVRSSLGLGWVHSLSVVKVTKINRHRLGKPLKENHIETPYRWSSPDIETGERQLLEAVPTFDDHGNPDGYQFRNYNLHDGPDDFD